MAFVVEDNTGLTNANAYVEVTYCDDYHTDRGNSAWTGIDTDKQAAIVRATQYVDKHYAWNGMRMTYTQILQWPRWNVPDDFGYWVYGVPERVKQAVCEAALIELVTPGVLQPYLDRGGMVDSQTVGPITTRYQPGATTRTTYPAIDELVKLYCYIGGMKVIRT